MAAEWQNTIHPRKVQQCEHTLLVLELVNLDISTQSLPNIILSAGSLKLKLFPFLPYPATVLPRADWAGDGSYLGILLGCPRQVLRFAQMKDINLKYFYFYSLQIPIQSTDFSFSKKFFI